MNRDLRRTSSVRGGIVVAAALALAALAGCGNKNKEATALQTAAKVNKEEITVHQINYVLSQQRGLSPAQAASASGQVLERLIDQELAMQKAGDQKIDRDPRVVQQLEGARREIISRAYLEKIGQGAPKPTPQEIKAYYDAHPALFSQRRLYSFQEVNIEAKPEQLDALKAKLTSSKDMLEFVAYLKANDIRFAANEAVRGAEQLPLASLDQIAQMKDGQSIFTPTPVGANVLYLAGSRSQPVDEQRAVPAIEQFLLNERKRKLVEDDLKALRSAAKIEYVGTYAADHAKAPRLPEPPPADAPPLTSVAPPLPPAASAAPQVEVSPLPVSAASMPSNSTLNKGLQGMK
ncbi:MAG: EpsD family peptidyl-prolyl cis-trans isomerase [Pseudomonadota bacterium]|nr:EpsD family peptidyl-prolyl cis-trans isomerase [Pseudomonadota bacterium]